jgi:hypothetical protein
MKYLNATDLNTVNRASSRPPFFEVQAMTTDNGIYSMRLPGGVYAEAGPMLLFRPEGPESPGFLLSVKNIVRVEGSEGELWQNSHFTPFGEVKAGNS